MNSLPDFLDSMNADQIATVVDELSKLKWLDPWFMDTSRLDQELARETVPGHLLYKTRAYAIARRQDNDDVLFLLPDHEYPLAVVHLTWQVNNSPEWPITEFYTSVDDFVTRCMIPDSLNP